MSAAETCSQLEKENKRLKVLLGQCESQCLKLNQKVEKIREVLQHVRLTGIPSVLNEHTAKMHVQLDAQMIVVKKIEEILESKE